MDIYEECEMLKEEIKALKAMLQDVKAERDHYKTCVSDHTEK